ncbi:MULTISPECIES: hypothetical protein [unclassified Streptomyces]|uniref:hypothetical protein n=1 Tax=unclassified Streptomyces TaxID=2593676 RepID=UPI0033AC57C1
MKSLSRAVRVVVSDPAPVPALPGHPASYGITDPAEVREVVAAVTAAEAARAATTPLFDCMCQDHPRLTLYDAGSQRIRTVGKPPSDLLGPTAPGAIPRRHRDAWASAAPEPLRPYARAWAEGDVPDPGTARSVPLEVVFGWLGSPRADDAAHVLARLAPLALLTEAPTADLAWAVRRTDTTGLDGAVAFFASEHFTTRHPKKRRIGATARDLLLRHARTRHPDQVAVLQRRLLVAADDRVTRGRTECREQGR